MPPWALPIPPGDEAARDVVEPTEADPATEAPKASANATAVRPTTAGKKPVNEAETMHQVITTQLEQKGQRTFSTACTDEKPVVKTIRPEKTTGGLQAFAPSAPDSASHKRHVEPDHTKNAMPSDATEAKRIRIDAKVHDAFPVDECESSDGLTQKMLGVIEAFEKEHHAHGNQVPCDSSDSAR